MPENILVNNFSAGWCPSDDEVNGRPNALVRMTNLELDQNGALQLIHGTQVLWSGYTGVGFRMYSKFINGVRYDYVACNDGTVYRNNNQIISGGNVSIAAFGTAFNYTLICSGTKKVKDNGVSPVNLGILPPTVAPTVTQSIADTPSAIIGNMYSFGTNLTVVVGSASVIGGNYVQCVTDANGNFIMQSVYSLPFNDNIMVGSVNGGPTPEDFVIINGYIVNPFGVSLEFDVLLAPGDPAGDLVNDMYSWAVADLSQQASFDSYTGAFTIKILRSQFNRIGSGAVDWSTVYGFRLNIMTNNPSAGVVDVNIWGVYMSDPNFTIRGGTNAQFGTYQYAQVNVNNTGSYIAKSILGPKSQPITLNGLDARVTIQNPTSVDPQCNEAWIFRTGGNLGGNWYRVIVSKPPFTSPALDTMGDQAALELDITMNLNLISIPSIPDTIFEIVGPIQGRWYYFTDNFMFPSEIDDPDLVDPTIAIRVAGTASEVLMWARNVSASVVLVGTTIDCYLLTGTFSTFPDGTIDVYYQPLGVKFPPITFDAESFGGAVYYLAADGWRFVLPTSFGTTYSSQNNQSMVSPNTDTLYRGTFVYNYLPPVMPTNPASVRFPLCIAKNKLWCFPGGTGRGEVWDFVRQYWRAYYYGNAGGASACTATQDNKVLVFSPGDLKVREHDYQGSKLIDFVTLQTFDVRFTYKDGGKPRQRKDIYTFKTRCYTGVGSIHLFFTDEQQNFIDIPTHITSSSVTKESYIDLAPTLNPFNTIDPLYLPKAIQVQLDGTSDDIVIQDWSVDFDSRPVPLTFLRIYPTNFGSATKKRLRTWPLVVDTLGNDVIFTPDVDGVIQIPTHFSTNFKQTVFHYFQTDIFGIDYGGTLHAELGGLMEVWDTGTGQLGSGLQPNIVQNLPIGTEFDQVGPIEIWRFGKIARMALRVYSEGTQIPFKVYLGDVLIYQDNFNVAAFKEDEYVVDLPKGVSGRVLRVELGPCDFVFYRYFMKFQVAISGSQNDTELRWLTVPGLSSTIAAGI